MGVWHIYACVPHACLEPLEPEEGVRAVQLELKVIANYHVVLGIETLSSGRIANALDCRVTSLVPAFQIFILKDLRTLHPVFKCNNDLQKKEP